MSCHAVIIDITWGTFICVLYHAYKMVFQKIKSTMEEDMKIAGSSRKDGMTLYGPHYKAEVTVKDGTPEVKVTKRATNDIAGKTKEIPLVRGLVSLLGNNGPMLGALGLEAVGELREAKGKSRAAVDLISIGLTGYLFYKIAGNVGDLRKFHGAEHMVIGAHEQGLPNDAEHVKTVSRVSPRCGTNFVGFYLPAQLVTAILPGKSTMIKSVLAMALAYEGFRLDREKYKKYVGPFYKLGSLSQQYLTTAEPEEVQLNAAIMAMDALLKAEAGETEE